MKLSIHFKLFLSYAGISFATLTVLGWTARTLMSNQFHSFADKIGKHGEIRHIGGPGENPFNLFLETMQDSLFYTTIAAGVLAILLSLLVSLIFTKPIKELIEGTKSIAKGDYKKRVNIHSEDELGELSHALNTMAACLEENQRLQQDLVTTMIHELATPLTNLTGYLEAMNDGLIKGKKRKETLELMSDEAARLTQMVKEVRELSHVQHPNFTIHPRKINLHNLVDKVITQMEPQLKEKDLRIVFKSMAEHEVLKLDRDRIIQLLLNLINNAISFSPKEGSIILTLKKKEKFIELQIEDQGPGIPKEDLPHLFERFYRADQSRCRKTGGLGIGLSIVKEIMDAHDGTVIVKSTPGKGSNFICQFPLKIS